LKLDYYTTSIEFLAERTQISCLVSEHGSPRASIRHDGGGPMLGLVKNSTPTYRPRAMPRLSSRRPHRRPDALRRRRHIEMLDAEIAERIDHGIDQRGRAKNGK
jgi:hypothetical protein